MRLMRLFLSEQQAQSSLALISPGRPPKGISDATEASQRRLCCQNGPGKGPRSYIAFGFCMMALTRILRGASSSANPFVSVSMAPFVDA